MNLDLSNDSLCVDFFFDCVGENIKKLSIRGDVLFVIASTRWLVSPGVEVRKVKDNDRLNPECVVTTDLVSMANLARGHLKPMTAAMNGTLHFRGDKKVFRNIGGVVRDAIKQLQIQYCKNSEIEITIESTFEDIDDKGKIITLYIIECKDKSSNNIWKIRHRFSDFYLLRKTLIQMRYGDLPQLPRRFFNKSTDSNVVKDRILSLSHFLNEIIRIVGIHNVTIAEFLQLVTPNFNNTQSSNSSLFEDEDSLTDDGTTLSITSGREQDHIHASNITSLSGNHNHNTIRSSKVQSSSSNIRSLTKRSSALHKARRHLISYDKVQEQSINSSYSASFPFKKVDGEVQSSHSSAVPVVPSLSATISSTHTNEIISLRQRIQELETLSKTNSLSTLAIYVVPVAILWVVEWLFLRIVVISHLRYILSSPFDTVSEVTLGDTTVLRFLLLAVAKSPYVICMALYCVMVLIVVTTLGSINTTFLPVLLILLELTTISDVTAPSDLVLNDSMYTSSWIPLSLHPSSLLLFLLVPSILVTRVHYTSQLCRLQRVLRIYLFASIVIGSYTVLKILFTFTDFLLRYIPMRFILLSANSSPSRSSLTSTTTTTTTALTLENQYNAIYAMVDCILAPFILNEIAVLQSVFIKVGQYLGGRPDMVSKIWVDTLSTLHNRCLFSSEQYVRTLVQTELGDKVENLFEEFDIIPVASASIAQVHFAKLIDGTEVAVKIQHNNVAQLMIEDIGVATNIAILVSRLDSKWEALVTVLRVWNDAMMEELDFVTESRNLLEARSAMVTAGFGAEVPRPIHKMVTPRILVMTRLRGFKITDNVALALHGVNKHKLMCTVAHCIAYQILVAGFFNADPHPGNVFCVQSSNSSHVANTQWTPGLLDFGMSIRLSKEKRLAYCKLMIALQECDINKGIIALKEINYVNTQTGRAPERDFEFFEFLMRDSSAHTSRIERKEFDDIRNQQKEDDVAAGTREREGRSMKSIPDEFFFLIRTIGLLRGLAESLTVSCPILTIFALHAGIGIAEDDDDNEE